MTLVPGGGHNGGVFRLCGLTALLFLSIWTVAIRADVCASSAAPVPESDGCTLALTAPSTDHVPDRHWEAVRSMAAPAGSVWTSQVHHATLASRLHVDGVRAPHAGDESAPTIPRALNPQFQLPLLI